MIQPPKNHLLGFLRARPRAIGEAFRSNPRHESKRRARISWQDATGQRTIKARLVDIGRMGAALTTTAPPPRGVLVCVRLVGLVATPWIEATVLGIEPTDGIYRVRVKFKEPCPTVLLKSAVLDPTAEASVEKPVRHTLHGEWE